MAKIIVLMGAPGAGKGTQARLLQERLHLPQISTGDIFRALKSAQTPLAHEVRDIMERGQLVPDELTIRVVKERTAQDDCKNGYILDGFPRTPAQARSLEQLAAEQQNDIIAVLIDVAPELLEKRMTGRRSCPVCNEIYNIYFKPPQHDNVCDLHPDATLVQRADDNSETGHARTRRDLRRHRKSFAADVRGFTRMIIGKSKKELEKMRAAGHLAGSVLA